MIKKMENEHLDTVMELWLSGNNSGHPFIPAQHWEDSYDLVKEMLPQADIYIYEDTISIKGFIGISENPYIAGLFVSPNFQGQGIGEKLLTYVKAHYNNLSLHVYSENNRAVTFYQKQGFTITSESINNSTGEKEYLMNFHSDQ